MKISSYLLLLLLLGCTVNPDTPPPEGWEGNKVFLGTYDGYNEYGEEEDEDDDEGDE